MKYYLESFYDYSPEVRSGVIDYVNIGAAVGTYENRKEEEWKTETESFKFKYYETLKEAILDSSVIADQIVFQGLSQEDEELVKNIVKELMNNEEYIEKFGHHFE